MEQAYAAIGRAVIAMQMFEFAFVAFHEHSRMFTDEAYRQVTGGIIPPGKFKSPTKKIVNDLKDTGEIADDLEARISALIEQRHELVHRWFTYNGWPWPDTVNAEDYARVIELAERVKSEADVLTHMMSGYMLKHAYPDAAERDPEARRLAMAEFFHKLHVQE